MKNGRAQPRLLLDGCNRRSFLLAGSMLAAGVVWSSRALGVVRRQVALPDEPFKLGVASGDPSPDGFVIWTRLAPEPLTGGGMPDVDVAVDWQVADDEAMTQVVARGTTTATADWAHSVHVEVEGLKPDRWYFYQFRASGAGSPVGRARTAPADDSSPKSLKFAVASCQHFESGLFTAYEHLAKEELDLVVHLGDYIYEYGGKEKLTRKHIGKEIVTLEDYRNRHAQYKSDEHLQAAHRAAPWIVTWDDHEFDNNCAGAISEEKNIDPAKFLERRAAAYRAYYEHMPLRKTSLPQGPDMRIYRRIKFGKLAEFAVLDSRQYRDDQPCGDGNKPQCEAALDPSTSLLGKEQERWLLDGLSASQAQWNVLAQQVMMARVDRIPGEVDAFSMDQWPGYEGNRRRILKHFAEAKIRNPVVLGGDIHSHWANDLIADFDELDSKVVASEFVTSSISSGGDGADKNATTDGVLAENPFVKLYSSSRGYLRCEITTERFQTDYRVVDVITKPGAPRVDRATLVVENGKAGVEQV